MQRDELRMRMAGKDAVARREEFFFARKLRAARR